MKIDFKRSDLVKKLFAKKVRTLVRREDWETHFCLDLEGNPKSYRSCDVVVRAFKGSGIGLFRKEEKSIKRKIRRILAERAEDIADWMLGSDKELFRIDFPAEDKSNGYTYNENGEKEDTYRSTILFVRNPVCKEMGFSVEFFAPVADNVRGDNECCPESYGDEVFLRARNKPQSPHHKKVVSDR